MIYFFGNQSLTKEGLLTHSELEDIPIILIKNNNCYYYCLIFVVILRKKKKKKREKEAKQTFKAAFSIHSKRTSSFVVGVGVGVGVVVVEYFWR